jgi:putative methyltransferase (TIGR04325 family)
MIKRLIKAVIPQSALSAAYQWHMRERRHKSWERAAAAAPAYADDDLTAFRVERSRRIIGQEPSYVQPPTELLSVMEAISGRFVDFGGATGEMCAVLQRRLPLWSFTVVETKAMAEAARDLRPTIAYSADMPEEFDVFYSSGTLQYLDAPELLWREALSRTAKHAYLARNSFSDRKIFSVQYSRLFDNGAGPIPPGYRNVKTRYPRQTISEAVITGIADEMGFDLVSRVADRNSGVIGTRSNVYGADLLFKRVR